MKTLKYSALGLIAATLLLSGCAGGRGVSTTSPDRQTQLTGYENGEGARKIPVTTTHGNY